MVEKKVWRKCERCLESRRTTVHENEEEIYICENCLKFLGRMYYQILLEKTFWQKVKGFIFG